MFDGKEGSSDLLVRVLHYSDPSGTSGYNKNFRNFFKLPTKARLKEAKKYIKRRHNITTFRQLYCSANPSQKGY